MFIIYDTTNKRTSLKDIAYSLHLYFIGLSLRNTSKAISRYIRSHTDAIRDWIQKYKPERVSYNKTKISEFIIDETQLKKVGSEIIWLWIATIESETNKNILAISISKERNMFVATERFLSNIVNEFDQHPVSTADGGGTWYPPQACKFLKLKEHHLHPLFEKSIIER